MGRRLDALEEARTRLLKTLPGACIEIHAGNALEPADVESAFAAAHALQNRLDIIVPAVGGGGFRPLLMHDMASFRAELDLNITSAFLALRYGVPLMEQGGSIICISSTAAVMPFPWLSAYCAGKGGLEQFVRSAADELSSAGIRVNAIRPGMTRSNATEAMFDTPEVIGSFVEQIPLRRGGDPDDIAAGVRFLAGPEASWVTGQSFAIDGGHELRRNPDLSGLVGTIFGQDVLAAVRAGRAPDIG
jgi:NAD(P)-dependent dehydrogenase (short-subunit alcohol dehydrogenase family)